MRRTVTIGVSIVVGLSLVLMPSLTNAKTSKKYFDGPCAVETKIAKEWAPLQRFNAAMGECLGPVKIVPVSLGKNKPKSKLSSANELQPVQSCKIENAPSSQFRLRAFPNPSQKDYFSRKLHPSANTVIQVVPIYASDTPVPKGSSPTNDYGRYFKFLKDYFKYASDGGSSFEIRVPENYLYFSKPLLPYNVTHHASESELQNQRRLGSEIISEVDSKINFSGTNMVLVVVPAGTSPNKFEQGGLGSAFADGTALDMISSAQPYNLTENPTRNRGFMTPMWWMHELYHIGPGLEDHNGNNYWQNWRGDDPTQPGMGNWGLLSMSKTELTTWEKWLLGMTLDSQVQCLDKGNTSQVWVAPTGVKTLKPKLAVIPISQTKVIVIESRRAAGLDYKLAKRSEGVLIYTVDTTQSDHEFGFKLISNRLPSRNTDFVFSDATLKKGETVSSDGVRITVVESGSFGDVIRVEPAS